MFLKDFLLQYLTAREILIYLVFPCVIALIPVLYKTISKLLTIIKKTSFKLTSN